MSSEDDNDKPPTSKKEAVERRLRPPPEKYDPDELPYWSITMTLAWIISRDLDAVRKERDDYRNECADWRFVPYAAARAKLLIPELQKELQKGSPWHLESCPPSGWNMRVSLELKRPALKELWRTAGEGGITATARECENVKTHHGDRIEIPARHWPHLKRVDDPLTGKAMLLSDDNGRVYRDIEFSQLDVKELWPKSPPLSDESREEPREDKKEEGPQQRRILPVLTKLFPPDGKVPDDVPTETVRGQVNEELSPENKRLGLREASWDSVNRALGRALPRR